MKNSISRRAAGAAAVLSICLSAACGSGSDGAKDPGGGQVASIGSETPSGGAKSATPTGSLSSESGVPMRLDMTDAEQTAIEQSYTHCLKDRGVPYGTKPWPGHVQEWVAPKYGADKYPDAYKACASKKPIQPPETDPAKNPHYTDDFRAWVQCMNRKGLKVEALSDGSGWNFADHVGSARPDSSQAVEVERACKLEAFGGEK
ncbi:hypothetical protein N4G69_44260 [Streptomyces mirabilis]|uniref:hypothetical protein n=1 Tax=Streptomyces mirabilis TaxID=68239 RepID=UPI0021C20E32|nr:hypothetical protein [Streptomyces mirabilis]MCT9112515.1 hypothetical protein [Streptomyces mirabilis]